MVSSPLAALDETVKSRPRDVAFRHGESLVTLAEWRARIDDYRHALLAHGARRGDRILLWMETGAEMAAAIFACWGVEAIAAIMDPRAGAVHFAHAVTTATPRLVIAGRLDDVPAEPHGVRTLTCAQVGRDQGSLARLPHLLPTDAASIVFTSGSTGRPKGVTQSHGNLLRGCLAVTGYLGIAAADRVLCTVPWTFDYGYGQLLTAAVRGASLVIPATPNPFGMCDAITRHQPTVLAGIPSVFTYLLRGVSPFRTTDVSSIRVITNTGGAIPAPVLDDLFDMFPRTDVFLNYGLTETYRTSYLDPALARSRRTSIGRAIPGVETLVVREDGTRAAPGEIGEIVHRGDYICMGYWNDPDATAAAIRPDPSAPPGAPRLLAFFTGDHGMVDEEGLLYFRGRRDHQLKSMGVRVNPAEVEELLYSSGLVREVAVVGAPHELIGDEICAFVVPHTVEPGLTERLGRYARGVMSPYMVPRRFVERPELPKTPTGKTDYPQLRRQAAPVR